MSDHLDPTPPMPRASHGYLALCAGQPLLLLPSPDTRVTWITGHTALSPAPDLPPWCLGLVPDRHLALAALVDLAALRGLVPHPGPPPARFLRRRLFLRRGAAGMALLLDAGLGWRPAEQAGGQDLPTLRLDTVWDDIAQAITPTERLPPER